MAVRFDKSQLYLEGPNFDYTRTPASQAQNAAGLVNIANSFKANQDNAPRWGTIAANGAANSIAKDATYMQEAGALLSAKQNADTLEKVHDMQLDAIKDNAREAADSSMKSSIGTLVGGGIGLIAGGGNPMAGAAGANIGSKVFGLF